MTDSSSTSSRPVNLKVLLVAATLLLGAVMYNTMGGWSTHDDVAVRREAALPLQARPSLRLQRRFKPDHDAVIHVEMPRKLAGKAGGTAVATAAAATAAAAAAATAAAAPPPPPSVGGAAPLLGGFDPKVDPDAYAATAAFQGKVDRMAAGHELGGAAFVADGLSCHAREGYDIAGDAAYVWGLAFNVSSAAECCAACAAQRRTCGPRSSRGKRFWTASGGRRTQATCSGAPGVCNSWVFCPGSDDTPGASDRCFSYTIHNHSKGECWLKHEANQSVPIAAGPKLPLAMRRAPRRDWPWAVAENVWPWAVPEKIAWQAGLLAAPNAPVWRGTKKPDWHDKFCGGKHGPC